MCIVSGFLFVKVCASSGPACYGQDEIGLPPTPDTSHLGCSYFLHSSHHFLSTLGAVMLKQQQQQQQQQKKTKQDVHNQIVNTTTYIHMYKYKNVANKLRWFVLW